MYIGANNDLSQSKQEKKQAKTLQEKMVSNSNTIIDRSNDNCGILWCLYS